MKTTYILKLNNPKYLERLLCYKVHFQKIKYQGDICFLYVNENDYHLLMKYFDIYGISLYQVKGLKHYHDTIKNNIIFIISMILGIIYMCLLSNIIFDIKIMTNNKDIIKIINTELELANLKKYRLVKSFKEKELIKEKILNNYKDKIEWIEIDRIGTKYYIRVLERIIHKDNTLNNYQSVVARKNGIIMEIKASSGEIIKKVNDYVSKGDIIISGEIHKNDDIVGNTSAKGEAYGETWYKIIVKLPIYFYEEKKTGNKLHNISISFFNKSIILFNSFKNKKTKAVNIYSDFFNIFNIKYNSEDELYVNESVNFITSENIALKYAQDKIKSKLTDKEYIIYQKKLKTTLNDSTINIEFFFKVYENITQYKRYSINKGM